MELYNGIDKRLLDKCLQEIAYQMNKNGVTCLSEERCLEIIDKVIADFYNIKTVGI